MSITETMQALADDGWCVVLKRLPAELGWLIQGARSEYDAPGYDQIVGCGKWCAEASDVRHGGPYRVSAFALADLPEEAVAKVASQCEESSQRAKRIVGENQ